MTDHVEQDEQDGEAPAGQGVLTAGSDERAGQGWASIGLFALGLGVVALVSSWTGWTGLVLGAVAVVFGVVAWLVRRGSRSRLAAIGGLVLGLAAVAVGLALQWDTLFGDADADFGEGLTLDQCMAQAPIAKLQHLCKAQHLQEFEQRYPNSDQ